MSPQLIELYYQAGAPAPRPATPGRTGSRVLISRRRRRARNAGGGSRG